MGYRDLEQRRMARVMADRRRLYVTVIVTVTVVYLVAGLAVLTFSGFFTNKSAPKSSSTSELKISFGFNRTPLTRAFTTSLPSSNGDDASASIDTLSVRLRTDLRNSAGSSEFPANQISIGVTRLEADKVYLTVTADPWTPEQVYTGTYLGTIDISGAGVSTSVPMQIYLGDRGGGWAWLAFTLLFSGALVGLVVKWITERLTPKAAMLRRVTNLKRSVGYKMDGSHLPAAVRIQIDDLGEAIERQDYARAEELFQELQEAKLKIAEISSRFDVLFDHLAEQSRIQDSRSLNSEEELLVTGVLDAEYRMLLQLQSTAWPDREEEIVAETQRCGVYFPVATSAILAYLARPSPELLDILISIREGNFEAGMSAYKDLRIGPPNDHLVADQARAVLVEKKTASRPLTSRLDEEPLSWLVRNARPMAAIASILVVSLVGLKTEFVESQTFDGSLGAWLTLGIWALVIELSGLSVLDVVGRLGSSAVGAGITPK